MLYILLFADAIYFLLLSITVFNPLCPNDLQMHTEWQIPIRGTNRGLHFYKETDKINKNRLFLEFLGFLHLVAVLNCPFQVAKTQ